jgi:glycosyltransferase involved in cell wall biosynthesis
MKKYALICAYNEEDNASDIIARSLKHVDKVIFVNDGSTDKTLDSVNSKFGNNSRVIVISSHENHGKGHAMIDGFRMFLKENGDTLVTLDADDQHNPDEIPVVTTMIENGYSDVVIGSRYLKLTGYPRMRVFFNVFSTMILLVSSGGFFTDVASGYRAYSNKAVKAILPRLDLQGYGIELEILQIAKEEDLKISTVPVSCKYDVNEKPNFFKLAYGYIRFAFKYKYPMVHRIFKF